MAQVPVLPDIPIELAASVRQPLVARHTQLQAERTAVLENGARHNQRCRSVEERSNLQRECLASRERLNGELKTLRAAVNALEDDIDGVVAAVDGARIIDSMNVLARRLRWDEGELTRLDAALRRLDVVRPNATDEQIRQAWQVVLSRGISGDLARAASIGEGPGFPVGAGQQSFQDCTIFALANAAGLPYGVVAARAAELISQGEWRNAAGRANPQRVIERRGLAGGEVVMLAEAFGQADVVPSSDFAGTLRSGRRLLLNVVPSDGNIQGGHAVVLTKTFLHGGETWYEMVESNQPPERRLYLRSRELDTMLKENGVAFRSEPGRTPRLLRTK